MKSIIFLVSEIVQSRYTKEQEILGPPYNFAYHSHPPKKWNRKLLNPIKHDKWEITFFYVNIIHTYYGGKRVFLCFCVYILTEFSFLSFSPPFHLHLTFSLSAILIGSVCKYISTTPHHIHGLSYHLLFYLIEYCSLLTGLSRKVARTGSIKTMK